MAITGGFFNSIENDRLYYADDINRFFEGIVGAGVFAQVDDGLQVRAGTGMQVQVMGGRLVDSKGRWLRNDAAISLEIDPADVLLSRYDAIIAAIDSSLPTRAPSIYVKKGTAASTPVKPTVTRNNYLEEYCLAYVYVARGVTSITQSAITDTRPDAGLCGFVTGLIDQYDMTELFAQYDASFREWFDGIKETVGPMTTIRSYSSVYTTTQANETVIPINIPQYNKEVDILQVYISGLKLIAGTEYTVTSDEAVTLVLPVDAGTVINFEVFKPTDTANTALTERISMLEAQIESLQTQLSGK